MLSGEGRAAITGRVLVLVAAGVRQAWDLEVEAGSAGAAEVVGEGSGED